LASSAETWWDNFSNCPTAKEERSPTDVEKTPSEFVNGVMVSY
jgi:hypothetical protein